MSKANKRTTTNNEKEEKQDRKEGGRRTFLNDAKSPNPMREITFL
jgi:hypothetical protein